jgi:hypothetical protein
MDWKLVAMIASFILGLVGIITSIILTTVFSGSRDNVNELKKALTGIIVSNSLGISLITVAAFIYFMRNPTYAYLYLLLISGVSLFVSFMAMSTSFLDKLY